MSGLSFIFPFLFSIVIISVNSFAIQQTVFNSTLSNGWQLDDSDSDSPILSCGASTDILQLVKQIDVFPNPPKKGENLTINAIARTYGIISQGAYADIQVHYGIIKLLTQKFDLCEIAKDQVDLECPINEGIYEISKSVELPSSIPPGTYKVHVDVRQENGEQITCLDAKVAFGF